jgi:hypothetical protein
MQGENALKLAVIFKNPQPAREKQYPNGWILLSGAQEFHVEVCHDEGRHPRVVRREAA